MQLAGGKLNVRALQGALVGPPWSKRQYGWHLSEAAEGGVTVYYEPHANHDLKSVQSIGQVDIAIIPTESTYAAGALQCVLVHVVTGSQHRAALSVQPAKHANVHSHICSFAGRQQPRRSRNHADLYVNASRHACRLSAR